MYKKAWCTCRVVVLLTPNLLFLCRPRCRRRRLFLSSLLIYQGRHPSSLFTLYFVYILWVWDQNSIRNFSFRVSLMRKGGFESARCCLPTWRFSKLNTYVLNVHFCLSAIRLKKGLLTLSVFEDLFTMSRKPCPIYFCCLLFTVHNEGYTSNI